MADSIVPIVLVAAWLVAAVATARRPGFGWLAYACGGVAALSAAVAVVDHPDAPGAAARSTQGIANGLPPALLCVIGIGLPNGRFVTASRRNLAIVVVLGGLAVGILIAERIPPLPPGIVATEVIVMALIALSAFLARC